MDSCPICGRRDRHVHRQPEERDAYFRAIMGAYSVNGERIMAGTIDTCEHVKQGAPVAGTLRGAPSGPNGDHLTFQACSNCIAQVSGAPAQTGKGGYSVGDGRYFGSKLG